jgi:putative transcriptional regulator
MYIYILLLYLFLSNIYLLFIQFFFFSKGFIYTFTMDNKFKEFRKIKKLSQEEMAKLLNVTRQTYINYESGEFEPSFKTLIKISKILEASIDELLDNPYVTPNNNHAIKKLVDDISACLDKYK